MCFLYSSKVVAPIQCISPLARAGLSIFEASIAPSAEPAPTIVCNSSINKMIDSLEFEISYKIDFNLSSNSPRYFAPANKLPKSRANTLVFFNVSGTSLFVIL